jgi:NADH:ubiquinone oxidoreductase subunit E
VNLEPLNKIIEQYHSEPSWLVMILQDIEREYNFLPMAALNHVAKKLNVPLSRVHQVATFYSSFSLKERGKYLIRVCDGTACHLKGASCLCDEIKRQIGIGQGQTTSDKKFSVEVVACLGACALAPVLTIGAQYYSRITPEKMRQILEEYRGLETAQATCVAGGEQHV